ncbi:hypothetical protein [Desulfitobacterium sp.]|uniref:hypothetical protein n=1 Tax=Desulfitobacterium sp. TaxID=49981 RepID=UPI002B20D761|nr:hypothetical protein [Desulfitobacterium sp.]MEA4902126.1 hypothetical protein [Desulfitobacterium sp.]
MLKKIVLILLITLIMSGCSSNQAAINDSITPGEESQNADSLVEQGDKEEPPIVPEWMGKTLESAPTEWGEIKIENNGFVFSNLKDVIFYTSVDTIISGIEIKNKEIDVYGSKVGQTPAEVKAVIGEPRFNGKNEEGGGCILEFELGDTLIAFYSSSDENSPVSNILLISHK